MAKGKNDVYILKVNGTFRVRPAAVGITNKLAVRNTTDHQVLIAFKPGVVAGDSAQLVKEKEENKEIDIVAGEGSVNPYKVFVIVNENPVPAEGESDPILIVDP